MAGRLFGKVAIITGGGRGIGRACALRFAREGASVCVVDRDLENARATAAEIEFLGTAAMAVEVDVTDEDAVEAAVATCVDRLGSADVLVSSAGLGSPRDAEGRQYSVMTMPTDVFRGVLDVNLYGTLFADRAVIRWLTAQHRPGSVINMASVMARIPTPRGAYNISKSGVWMLTKCLAIEVAHLGIRVNAIGPGFIETPMTEQMRADLGQSSRAQLQAPMGRFGRADEVASVALFLASEDASFVTGELVHPSGGMFVG